MNPEPLGCALETGPRGSYVGKYVRQRARAAVFLSHSYAQVMNILGPYQLNVPKSEICRALSAASRYINQHIYPSIMMYSYINLFFCVNEDMPRLYAEI